MSDDTVKGGSGEEGSAGGGSGRQETPSEAGAAAPGAEPEPAAAADRAADPVAGDTVFGDAGRGEGTGAAPERASASAEEGSAFVAPAPPSSAPAAPPPPAARGGGFAAVLWTLVAIAAVGVGGFFTRAMWWPAVEPFVGGLLPAATPGAGAGPDFAARLEGTVAEQTAMRQGLADLAATLKGLQDKLAAVEGRVDGLAGQIGALKSQPEAAAPGAPPAVPQALAATVAGVGQRAEALGRQTEALVKQTEALSRQTETLARETVAVGSKAESLAQRIDDLARRADGFEAQLAQVADAPVTAKALMPRVDALEADSLQTKRLADRFREVETATKETVDKAQHLAATVLAVQQLKAALAGSGPFSAQLASLRALARDDAELQAALASLEPRAANGIPSLAALQGSFPAVAAAVSRAGAARAGESWGERTLNRLAGLVTVRRVGPAAVEAGGTEGALALAEQTLGAGDLAGAVAALDAVQGADAEPLQPWLADARARLVAERALADTEMRATARLREARG